MRRWINTKIVYDSNGRIILKEGYWYNGPIAEAVAMSSFDQDSFAFYNDDGSESSSTQIGTTNSETTLEVNTTYHARLLVQEAGGASGTFKNIIWEYNHNGAGWIGITTSSSVVKAVDSTNLTDSEDTTQRIGSGTYESTNGLVCETGTSTNITVNANNEVECVLAFQIISSDVSNSDEILLRIQGCDTFTLNADINVNKVSAPRRIFIV